MREFFKSADDGIPHWQIFSCCKNLTRTIPLMVFDDKKNNEDVADNLEDHACESARYALMSRPRPKPGKIESIKPKGISPFDEYKPKGGGKFLGI